LWSKKEGGAGPPQTITQKNFGRGKKKVGQTTTGRATLKMKTPNQQKARQGFERDQRATKKKGLLDWGNQ